LDDSGLSSFGRYSYVTLPSIIQQVAADKGLKEIN